MSRYKYMVFIFILVCFVYHLCFIHFSSSRMTRMMFSSDGDKSTRFPGCILIGVRKGGTRALLDMLNLHSEIRAANIEVHFFDNDTNYKKGLEWYKDQMPPTGPSEMSLEKSPSYFVTPSVPKRVHAMDRNVKLLLIVRDPLTRLVSDYTQILTNHKEKGLVYKPFKTLAFNPDGSVNMGYDALTRSLYVNFMQMWLEYFPLNQIHVVNGEKLIKKPWHEIRKVEMFLGLKPEITRQNFFFNSTKGFHCIQRNDEEHCLAKSKGRSHPNISSSVVHKLRTFFRPYNYKFYNLVGQDFGWPDE
jgi:hypothetical protein